MIVEPCMIFKVRHAVTSVVDTFEAEGYETYDSGLIAFKDGDREVIKLYVIRNIVSIDVGHREEEGGSDA